MIDPSAYATKALGGLAAQEDWGGGRSSMDVMNPQWAQWFDMLNARAPGGIKGKKGAPGPGTQASPALGALQQYQPGGSGGY